jgi:dTDP-4-dehydrorhamnose 3,5-epimerase
MKFEPTPIEGVYIAEAVPHSDDRGYFGRVFCKKEFEQTGFTGEWVQINHSYNRIAGTFRGFHYQLPPSEETKLIRCVSGGITDFVLDLRKGSSTFLQTMAADLNSKNLRMMLIPPGVAHAFLTLQDNTDVIYHHSQFYNKDLERGVRHDDPMLSFKLPSTIRVISERDKAHPFLPAEFMGIEL